MTVRQSIVYVAIRVVLLQILFGAMYLAVFAIGQFFFRSSDIAPIIMPLATLAIIPAIVYQLYETTRILLRWLGNYYIIKSGEIVFMEGIINRKQNLYPLKHIRIIEEAMPELETEPTTTDGMEAPMNILFGHS